MSGSNKKMKIDELQHARKVKRSGTSGSKKVAKGGNAVGDLAEAIGKLPAGERTVNVIEALNKLVKHYDAVILVSACTMCAMGAEWEMGGVGAEREMGEWAYDGRGRERRVCGH